MPFDLGEIEICSLRIAPMDRTQAHRSAQTGLHAADRQGLPGGRGKKWQELLEGQGKKLRVNSPQKKEDTGNSQGRDQTATGR